VILLEKLDSKFSGLVEQLFADDVVNQLEKEEVRAEQTSFRANEKLLSVLSRKSPERFKLFLNALDNYGQRHVRDIITNRRGLTVAAIYWKIYNPVILLRLRSALLLEPTFCFILSKLHIAMCLCLILCS